MDEQRDEALQEKHEVYRRLSEKESEMIAADFTYKHVSFDGLNI